MHEKPQNYTEPFSELPILEREIIRLRTYELTLVLYYKEEIQRSVVDAVESHDRWKSKADPSYVARVDSKDRVTLKIALRAMQQDGALSRDEVRLIRKTVDFRNDVGHRVDHVFSDLQEGRYFDPELRAFAEIKEFDHLAIDNWDAVGKLIGRVQRSHYRIGTFSTRGSFMFDTTEKSLRADIRKSKKKIKALSEKRALDIARLNPEISKANTLLNSLYEGGYFDIRFHRGPMTARGVEFCYQLFELGISNLAVAFVFEMKLRAIQARRKGWLRLGGRARSRPDWEALPRGIAPSPYDD